jgi:hypothetical protein
MPLAPSGCSRLMTESAPCLSVLKPAMRTNVARGSHSSSAAVLGSRCASSVAPGWPGACASRCCLLRCTGRILPRQLLYQPRRAPLMTANVSWPGPPPGTASPACAAAAVTAVAAISAGSLGGASEAAPAAPPTGCVPSVPAALTGDAGCAAMADVFAAVLAAAAAAAPVGVVATLLLALSRPSALQHSKAMRATVRRLCTAAAAAASCVAPWLRGPAGDVVVEPAAPG